MASGAPPIARTRAGRAATSVDCLARQIQQERCGTGHRNSDHQSEQTDQLPRPCTKRRSWARFRQLHQMRRHSLYLDGAPDRISRRSDIPKDGSSSVHIARVVEALEKPKRRWLQTHRLAAGGASTGSRVALATLTHAWRSLLPRQHSCLRVVLRGQSPRKARAAL